MKHILYYKLNNSFISDQTAAGGDGTNVVSVVNGVARTMDARKVYYRYSGNLNDVNSYTVTVHYKDGNNATILSDDVYTVTVYSGKSTSFFVSPKSVDGYTPEDSGATIMVSGNTEYVFSYYSNNAFQVEYIETTAEPTNDISSAITTDFDLSDPDAFHYFKAVFSFYIPSVLRSGTTNLTTNIVQNNKFVTNFYNNGGNIGETTYRLNLSNQNIVEHDTFSAPYTKGANILCAVYNYQSQGYGSYYLITANLTGPQNNYPYSSFDNYRAGNMSRLYNNYIGSGGFSETVITFFRQNVAPGTRFYGLKIYGYGSGVAEPSTVVYDFVPYYRGGKYGIFEKINKKFYTRQDLIGPSTPV